MCRRLPEYFAIGKLPFQMIEDVNLWGLAVSHDGTPIATGREDDRLEFRNPEALEVTKELKPNDTLFLAITFYPDGSRDFSLKRVSF